jgi:HAD superfamily hydrolase (TIGR01509 family)
VVRAILWDNDGVLVDTEHLYFGATRDALAGLGVALDLDGYRALSLTQGRSCFDLAREAGVDDGAIDAARRERDAVYHARVRAGVELIDGVRETLEALHGLLPMAIVTSSRPENLHAAHRHHAIDRYFELVLASGDYARSKPHPDPYLTAAERLGLAPEDCLVVEDSARGLQAAVAAGIECWVIPNALTVRGDFSCAHRVLGTIREVVPGVAERRPDLSIRPG